MKLKLLFTAMVCILWLCGCAVGGTVEARTTTSTSTTVYSLHWEFDANGGTGSVEPVSGNIAVKIFYYDDYEYETYSTVLNKKTYRLPYGNNLTKEGWVFCGWSKSPYGDRDNYQENSGEVLLYSSNSWVYTENLEVTWYAIWRQKHTVTFDANGGTGSVSSIEYMLGDPLNKDVDCQYLDIGYEGERSETDDNTKSFNSYTKSAWKTYVNFSNVSFNKSSDSSYNYYTIGSFNTKSDGSGTTVSTRYNYTTLYGYSYSGSIPYSVLGDDITLYAIWKTGY